MKDLSTALSTAEMQLLDSFLLDRIDEDAVEDGDDEGVLNISELDGLLTAVVSGPSMIPPSLWIPAIWGDFEPSWESESEFSAIFSLLMRHMNSIASRFMDCPDEAEPIFMGSEVDGRSYTIVDEWCEGYLTGAALAEDQWKAGGEDIARLMVPILAFTGETDWSGHEIDIDGIEKIQAEIAPNMRAIHAFWLARRAGDSVGPGPVSRSQPRVGRNAPCPCGSGKKYKKCCLH